MSCNLTIHEKIDFTFFYFCLSFVLQQRNCFNAMKTGENNLKIILKTLKPKLNTGDFVFCVLDDLSKINSEDIIMMFREGEGNTIIVKKELADHLKIPYSFVSAWITLTVHSSLTAVGLTAAFSKALSEKGISCNVVAAFFHDHIFVDKKDVDEAMRILTQLSE